MLIRKSTRIDDKHIPTDDVEQLQGYFYGYSVG